MLLLAHMQPIKQVTYGLNLINLRCQILTLCQCFNLFLTPRATKMKNSGVIPGEFFKFPRRRRLFPWRRRPFLGRMCLIPRRRVMFPRWRHLFQQRCLFPKRRVIFLRRRRLFLRGRRLFLRSRHLFVRRRHLFPWRSPISTEKLRVCTEKVTLVGHRTLLCVNMAMLYRCEMCSSNRVPFVALNIALIVNHYGRYHWHNPDFYVTCKIAGCSTLSKAFEGYKSHLHHHHKEVNLRVEQGDESVPNTNENTTEIEREHLDFQEDRPSDIGNEGNPWPPNLLTFKSTMHCL